MTEDRVSITLPESAAEHLLDWLENLQVGLDEASFLSPLRDELAEWLLERPH